MKNYCIEVCCMKYGNAFVEAATPEDAMEKARGLYEARRIDWNSEEIKQLNVVDEEEIRNEGYQRG